MSSRQPEAIPYTQNVAISRTDLDTPELPGDWTWLTASRISMTDKVVVRFCLSGYEADLVGEIDNWLNQDGEQRWTTTIRESGTEEPESTREYATLESALDALPEYIATHHEIEA